MDFGRKLVELEITISGTDTALDTWRRLLDSVVQIIESLEKSISQWIQDSSPVPRGGYSRSDLARLKELSFEMDPLNLERVARALYFLPYEPAYLLLGETKLFLSPRNPYLPGTSSSST